VAGYLLERFGEAATSAGPEEPEARRDEIGALSDEESRRLLMEELQALGELDDG
jgi:hypothetical protein